MNELLLQFEIIFKLMITSTYNILDKMCFSVLCRDTTFLSSGGPEGARLCFPFCFGQWQ